MWLNYSLHVYELSFERKNERLLRNYRRPCRNIKILIYLTLLLSKHTQDVYVWCNGRSHEITIIYLYSLTLRLWQKRKTWIQILQTVDENFCLQRHTLYTGPGDFNSVTQKSGTPFSSCCCYSVLLKLGILTAKYYTYFIPSCLVDVTIIRIERRNNSIFENE